MSVIALALISLIAATAYGALGYGFSSIAVPLALLVVSNRELNPALILVGVGMNAHALWANRRGVSAVWPRAAFVIAGLLPGTALGTMLLARVDASALKLATFAVLLPLILLQTAGYRRPIRSERTAGIALGAGVGTLYAVTTISGPPLAMFFANQGYAPEEFRAGLGLIRLAESLLAAVLYAGAGLFTDTSLSLLGVILPSAVVGVSIGAVLIRRVHEEAFRRVAVSFDAVIVAFGISSLLRSRDIVDASLAYLPFVAVVVFVGVVLYRVARGSTPKIAQCTRPQAP